MYPFSQGLAAATGIDFAPTRGSQFTNASQMNSDPLSLLMRVGAPRRPMTRAKILRTSAPVSDPAACSTKHSRVYSSTKVSHLRERPSAVRSWMKSQVQTSFLNRAGCWTQLFALTPGFGPNFLGFRSLTGLLSPRLIQSLRTRLRLTDQPFRTNTAWARR